MTPPGRERFDVAVVGGGSAGVAAARASAALGARTLLLEATDRLGGNASLAGVHTICGLYHAAGEEPARLAQSGFAGRLPEALQSVGAAGPAEQAGKVHYLPIDPHGYRDHLHREVVGQPDLEIRLQHPLQSVQESAEGFHFRAGAGEFAANLVIDASGAAVAAEKLGAGRRAEPADRLQCPSLILRLAGVQTEELRGFARLHVTAAVAKAAKDGELPPTSESVVVRPGLESGEVFLTLGVARPVDERFAPLDEGQLQRLYAGARTGAEAVVAYLCRERPAFADAHIVEWPQRLGVREAARGETRDTLDREDILKGRRRDDEVAISTWPIELWRDHRRARFEHPTGPSGIPLGSLVSRSHPRLGFAGRCMGGTQESLGALRVIGTALATGEAAGVAAALAADAGTNLAEVEPAQVRTRILGDANLEWGTNR